MSRRISARERTNRTPLAAVRETSSEAPRIPTDDVDAHHGVHHDAHRDAHRDAQYDVQHDAHRDVGPLVQLARRAFYCLCVWVFIDRAVVRHACVWVTRRRVVPPARRLSTPRVCGGRATAGRAPLCGFLDRIPTPCLICEALGCARGRGQKKTAVQPRCFNPYKSIASNIKREPENFTQTGYALGTKLAFASLRPPVCALIHQACKRSPLPRQGTWAVGAHIGYNDASGGRQQN